MKRVCGCAVVRLEENGIKILLVEDPNGMWGIPKGHVDENEEPINAAVRETKEETGLDVKALKFLTTEGRLSVWWAIPLDPDAEPTPQPGEINSCGYFHLNELPKIDPRQAIIFGIISERLRDVDLLISAQHAYG